MALYSVSVAFLAGTEISEDHRLFGVSYQTAEWTRATVCPHCPGWGISSSPLCSHHFSSSVFGRSFTPPERNSDGNQGSWAWPINRDNQGLSKPLLTSSFGVFLFLPTALGGGRDIPLTSFRGCASMMSIPFLSWWLSSFHVKWESWTLPVPSKSICYIQTGYVNKKL